MSAKAKGPCTDPVIEDTYLGSLVDNKVLHADLIEDLLKVLVGEHRERAKDDVNSVKHHVHFSRLPNRQIGRNHQS